MSRRISLRHLRCFAAVAEAESFTVAASRLFLTQSSLTTTIQQFEDEVGLKLFDRNTRRVVMTREAQRFKIEADYILNRFDNAIGDLQAFAQGRQGQIRIAASISVIEHILADAITAFKLIHPNIGISLRDAGAELVENKLLEGEIDFAVTSPHKGLEELSYSPLLADSYGVVCADTHPYARCGQPMDWAYLDPKDYIRFTSDTGIGSFLEAQAPRKDLFDKSQDIVSSTSSLYPLLKSGDRYAILPALSAKTQAFSGFSFRLLAKPALEREIYLITRRLRSLSPISETFLAVLKKTIREKRLPGGVSLRMADDPVPDDE
ncbi:MAG: LysR family transcriptional regulator [Burkholderiaceae bacterium]